MTTIAVPSRITIDFRGEIHPSRTWILGLDDTGRADLLAFDEPSAPALRSSVGALPDRSVPAAMNRARPTALSAPCACPDFCERDHANE